MQGQHDMTQMVCSLITVATEFLSSQNCLVNGLMMLETYGLNSC